MRKQQSGDKTKYHAITRGFFVDVLCYQVDGRRIRQFIREEIVSRLGNGAEFYLGCPSSEQHRMALCEPDKLLPNQLLDVFLSVSGLSNWFKPQENSALAAFERDYLFPNEANLLLEMARGIVLGRSTSQIMRTFSFLHEIPPGNHLFANHVLGRSLPLASIAGATNAKTLARIGQELAQNGGVFLSPSGYALAEQHEALPRFDEILGLDLYYTNCGWGFNRFVKDWVGWDGAGGSMLMWCPKHKASFAYVPSRMDSRLHRTHALRMLTEFIKVLESTPPLQT